VLGKYFYRWLDKLGSKETEISSTIYNKDEIYAIIISVQRDYILEAFIETYGILSSRQGYDNHILRESKCNTIKQKECISRKGVNIGVNISHRSKHIHIRYNFSKEASENGNIEIRYLESDHMIADILIKVLPRIKHEKYVRIIKHECKLDNVQHICIYMHIDFNECVVFFYFILRIITSCQYM